MTSNGVAAQQNHGNGAATVMVRWQLQWCTNCMVQHYNSLAIVMVRQWQCDCSSVVTAMVQQWQL